MGDKEDKSAEYTEDELSEINRILKVLPEGEDEAPEGEVAVDSAEESQLDDLTGFDEPVDDIDTSSLDDLTGIDEPVDDLDLSSLDGLTGVDESVDDTDFSPLDDLAGIEEPVAEVPLDIPGEGDEIEDITDLIEDVVEPDDLDLDDMVTPEEGVDTPGEGLDDFSMPSGDDEPIEELDVSDISEVPDETEDLSSVEELSVDDLDFIDEEPAEETPEGPMSTLDELDALTTEEPDSVDAQEISDDRFVDDMGIVTDESSDIPEVDEIDEVGTIEDVDEFDDFVPTEDESTSEMRIDNDQDSEIPDLSDISVGEVQEIPEASFDDIPDVDIDGMGEVDDAGTLPSDEIMDVDSIPSDEMSEIDTLPSDEITELAGEMDTFEEAPSAELDGIDSFGEDEGVSDVPDIPAIDEIDDIVTDEDIPEPDDEPAGDVDSGTDIELSTGELKKLKTAILLFHPNLRKKIQSTILNDALPPQEIRSLVDIIIEKKPESEVHSFLEEKLGIAIDVSGGESTVSGRRVITTRPEYSTEGMARQRRLLKLTRIFGIVAVLTCILTVLGYQYVYKPKMAKSYIMDGVKLIRQPGEPIKQKLKDYRKAEELFKLVDEEYIEDFLFGYNKYARAYFDKREYDFAYSKLQQAYEIDKTNVETLNNLGHFFSKIPAREYRKIRPADSKKSQLDVAIRYYKIALNAEPENMDSLFGIGNAYMFQGQFFKARQYYENILKIDRKSIVGFSGLLNLFIERDNFPEILSIHADLRMKEMMPELPSALLGKLASYYMGKKRTDTQNIRVDYGVKSSTLKDMSDNPYPAVRSVLRSLQAKDINYPPLYFHFARLSRAEGNYRLMEEYLLKALKKDSDLYGKSESTYFDGLHLLGEYYLLVKEPVKAYSMFAKAIRAHSSPPEFTFEDFYQQTEQIGKTHAMVGNIFYYFFDKVKYRFGDELEDEKLDLGVDKMANYRIARERYETALKDGYRSPELFYNLGRIYYMKGLYENYGKAIEYWLNLYEDFAVHPELMFALGNAFYHINNFEASKGEYLKLISLFERNAEKTLTIFPEKKKHIMLFQTLSSAYNNLGAVYQRQENEVKSSISYWKAIDYAKRIERENEFSRVNLARSFKVRKDAIMPIIDENIPFSIDVYRESMR